MQDQTAYPLTPPAPSGHMHITEVPGHWEGQVLQRTRACSYPQLHSAGENFGGKGKISESEY